MQGFTSFLLRTNGESMKLQSTEKGQARWREIQPFIRTPESIIQLAALVDVSVADRTATKIGMAEIIDPRTLIVLVDDVGALFAIPDSLTSAHVHISFWDRRLRGREQLCRQLAQMVLRQYGFHYLYTAIPARLRTVIAFAKRVGFIPVTENGDTVGFVFVP
jgi:hypothetical protein